MPHERSPQPSATMDQWLAMRYLTGDLDEVEWAAFEDRLDGDFALQATLADTVKLTGGLMQVDQLASPRRSCVSENPRRGSDWRAGIGMVGLMAAVLLSFGLLLDSRQSEQGLLSGPHTSSMDVAAADIPAVVAMWSTLSGDVFVTHEERVAMELVRPDANDLDARDASDLDVPSWLLLAVHDEMDESVPADQSGGEPL